VIFSEMRRTYKQLMAIRDDDPAADSGDPPNSVINADLHAAARHMMTEISGTMPERLLTRTTVTVAGTADYVTLTSIGAMSKIARVACRPTGSSADPIQLRAVRQTSFLNLPAEGTPEVYARLADLLYVRPKPASSFDFIIDYVPDYSAIADNATITWLPTRHHEIIPVRAVLLRKRVLGDDTRGLQQTYDEMLAAVVADLAESIPDTGVNYDDNLGDFYE